MEKIMQKTNANKRFATFPTMIKHEKHVDNKEKTSENPDEFVCSLVKSLKIRFLYPIKKVHENAIIRNEKPQKAEKRYL